MKETPKGLCQCGCGTPVGVYTNTNATRGHVKGEPRKYISGHKRRLSAVEYIVDPVTGCWIWQLTLNNKGYARIRHEGKTSYAHIVNWEKINGPVPEGYELHHFKCETPACVNPEHVTPVTHTVNMRLGRQVKFTEEQVREIKRLNKEGIGYRRLAKLFNRNRSAIGAMIRGQTWKGIE